MAKTIAEICIANVGKGEEETLANYEAAGYENKFGKITEFAMELNNFPRNDGALALLRELLTVEQSEFEKVKLAPKLIQHTRLLAGEMDTDK